MDSKLFVHRQQAMMELQRDMAGPLPAKVPPPSDQRRSLTAVAITWDEFTKNTTFHGIRYIFGSSIAIRRFVWFVCVTAAVTTFMYQVIQRSSTFLDYNTNVDVQVLYTDEVPFPAVTICNQNTFRFTAAQDAGVYKMLYDIYTSKLTEDELISRYGDLTARRMADIIKDTSHDIDDFIVGCRWIGEPCNIAEVFQPVFTEYGLCYTFNGNEWDQRASNISGSKKGLSLILNVEYYEYMVGPQTAIGIQMLVHNKTESAQMETMGFAVAPGTHTYVGITRTEESYRETPYGVCVPGSVPMSTCSETKLVDSNQNYCNCTTAFSHHPQTSQDFDSCNVTSQYFCVPGIPPSSSHGGSSCSLPCDRTIYDYGLSYATLAKDNIEAVLFEGRDVDVEEEAIEHKLRAAREAFYRHEPTKSANFLSKQTSFEAAFDALLPTMEEVQGCLGSPDTLGALYGLPDIIKQGTEVQKRDVRVIERLEDRLDLVHDMEDFYEDTYILMAGRVADDFASMTKSYMSCMLPDLTRTDYNVTCRGAIGEDLVKLILGGYKYYGTYSPFENLPSPLYSYQEMVDVIFTDIDYDLSAVPQHQLCLQQITAMNASLQVSEQLVKLTRALMENSQELSDTVAGIVGLMNDVNITQTLEALSAFTDGRHEYCSWTAEHEDQRDNVYDTVKSKFHTAEQEQSTSRQSYKDMADELKRCMAIMNHSIRPYIDAAKLYRNGSVNLRSMSRTWLGIADHAEALVSCIETFMGLSLEFQRQGRVLPSKLKEGYHSLWEMDIPIMTYTGFFELNLWTHIIENATASSVVAERERIRNMTEWPPNLDKIIDDVYAPFITYPGEMESRIFQQLADFNDGYVEVLEHTNRFRKSILVNEDMYSNNFLKVDVFYKELKYTKVSQQPAFELLSLLSEVGGFLGLLLGASVLTICEILDFFILHVIARCKDWQMPKRSRASVIKVQPKFS